MTSWLSLPMATRRDLDLVDEVYQPRGFIQEQLAYDSENEEFVLTDTTGAELRFFDFSSSLFAVQRGQLKSYTDPNGNSLTLAYSGTDGRLAEVERVSVVGGTTITESFLYTHVTSGDNAGLVSSIELRRKEEQRVVGHSPQGGIRLLRRIRRPRQFGRP